MSTAIICASICIPLVVLIFKMFGTRKRSQQSGVTSGMRYIVTGPVNNGNCWWYVTDTQNGNGFHFHMVEISDAMPGNPGSLAHAICDALNHCSPLIHEDLERWAKLISVEMCHT